MGELQAASEGFSLTQAFLWCFYPITALSVIDFLLGSFDDDDDQGGGMMIPAYQGNKA